MKASCADNPVPMCCARGDVFRAAGEMGARLEALAAQNEALRTARDQLVLLVEKSSALLDFYKTDNVGV